MSTLPPPTEPLDNETPPAATPVILPPTKPRPTANRSAKKHDTKQRGTESRGTGQRKRGAQPGNKNALRHGFYSKSFTPSEMQQLDSNVKGEFHDEINAARVNTARLAELMKDYRNMPLQDFISASNALNNYLDRIQSLSRAQKFIYQNQTTIEKALEELAPLPPEED